MNGTGHKENSGKTPSCKAYLALGGNVGDVRESFRHALKRLDSETGPIKTSNLYRTLPWGEVDQPPFLNMVLEFEWTGTPEQLLRLALEIERERGRDRSMEQRWGPRTLDIDLLIVGDWVLNEESLILPHPRMQERSFVLKPLADLAPDLIPPGWTQTVFEALKAIKDLDTIHPEPSL